MKRCAEQSWSRGGNASNSATILASIGVDVEYLGTLADDALLRYFHFDIMTYYVNNSQVVLCSSALIFFLVLSDFSKTT